MTNDVIANSNEYKNKCLRIIENYIEIDDYFNVDQFLRDCQYLNRAFFDCLVEERASVDICGYAPCKKHLSIANKSFKNCQKYHIQNNKVFDITRRRNFCSDLCFKSNEFLAEQIPTESFFDRENVNKYPKLALYQSTIGLVGDEVPLTDPIPENNKKKSPKLQKTKKEILIKEKRIESKLASPYLKDEEYKELKDKFVDFNIREKFDNVTSIKNDETMLAINNSNKNVENNLNQLDDDLPETNKTYYDELIDEIDRFSISTTSSMSDLSTIPKVIFFSKV